MQSFTVALVLALAVAANASLHQLGWAAGSQAIHVQNAWAASPHAGLWAPSVAHWDAAPAAVAVLETPGAGHWAAPSVAHWAPSVAHWAPAVAVHSAPIEHSATYVAANRGSKHVAPLPGHVQSVKSLNVAPAPGTNW